MANAPTTRASKKELGDLLVEKAVLSSEQLLLALDFAAQFVLVRERFLIIRVFLGGQRALFRLGFVQDRARVCDKLSTLVPQLL